MPTNIRGENSIIFSCREFVLSNGLLTDLYRSQVIPKFIVIKVYLNSLEKIAFEQ